MRNCPKCGKPMIEQECFPGLWLCEDYQDSIGWKDGRFIYRCTGMRLTQAGAREFTDELERHSNARN